MEVVAVNEEQMRLLAVGILIGAVFTIVLMMIFGCPA